MKYIIQTLVLISFCISCHNTHEQTNVKHVVFNNVDSIVGEKMLFSPQVIGASDIDIVDSLLIFTRSKADNYFAVYDAGKGMIIGEYINRGKANNEMISPSGVTYIETDSDIIVHSFDYGRSKIFKFNLSESIKQDRNIAEFDNFASKNILTTHQYLLQNNEYLTRYLSDEGSVYIDIIDGADNLKSSSKIVDAEYKYDSFLASATNYICKDKMVLVYNFLDYITIIDIEKPEDYLNISTSKTVSTLNGVTRTSAGKIMERYCDVKATEEYIYALYINATRKEWAETPVKTQIHIFDWDGNPIKEIRLDHKITNIAVDKSNQYIYGLNSYTEEVYRYKLSL